jgi:hypothetical protein
MRTVLTVLLAAAVGIHCSSGDAMTAPVQNDEPAITADEPAQPSATPRSDGAPAGEGDESDPRWAIEKEGNPPTLITTTARGSDDALYAAGTFSGWLSVGDDTLKSKGGDDVFLVRFDPNGSIAWARAIGSVRAERAPRVSFVDGQVKLIARTDGEVDCGSGGMGKWSSEMFFYCMFAPDGSALGGGSFPTGSP